MIRNLVLSWWQICHRSVGTCTGVLKGIRHSFVQPFMQELVITTLCHCLNRRQTYLVHGFTGPCLKVNAGDSFCDFSNSSCCTPSPSFNAGSLHTLQMAPASWHSHFLSLPQPIAIASSPLSNTNLSCALNQWLRSWFHSLPTPLRVHLILIASMMGDLLYMNPVHHSAGAGVESFWLHIDCNIKAVSNQLQYQGQAVLYKGQ